MSFLRDLWSDLVEKRLWPLAVVLVLALIAAPIVLARGGGAGTESPLPAAPAPAPASASGTPADEPAQPVELDVTAPQAPPTGDYKDPFEAASRAAEAAAAAEPPAGAAGSSGGSASSSSVPADPAPAASPSTGAGPSIAPADDPGTTVVTHPSSDPAPSGVFAGQKVDVHWGQAGTAKRESGLVRLARLDAGDEPLLVFLGVRRDGDKALFAVVTDTGAAGDGRCMPATKSCQVIEIAEGESEFFDVTQADGSIAQYELDVDRIAERRAETAAEARKQRAERSRRGRELLRDTIAAGRDYAGVFDYSTAKGVVLRDVDATKAWFRQATYAEVDAVPAQ
jgi:hypothetical protein